MKIAITAESTCDLTPQAAERLGVEIVPLSIVTGDRSYRDGLEISPDDIFEMVRSGEPIPKTSAVNVAEYREMFERLLRDFDHVIHITLGSGFSSCYANSRLAAEGLSVDCVDSENLSMGTGHLVLEAASLRDQGLPPEEIVSRIKAMRPLVETTFIIDRLDYLWKGGRCSTVSALGANLLKLRPVIELTDGAMHVGRKYRGAYDRCARHFVEDTLREGGRYDRLILGHTGCDMDMMNELAELAASLMGVREIEIVRVGCAITTHCGENTVGLFLVRGASGDAPVNS